MYFKNYPKAFTRRCRLYLFRSIVIVVCVGVFLQIKYSAFDFISKKSIENSVVPDKLSPKKLTLDCTGDPLQQWCETQVELCDAHLVVYNKTFVMTKEAILEPKLATGKRTGGENIQDVLNQPEGDEYFHFQKDFLKVNLGSSL